MTDPNENDINKLEKIEPLQKSHKEDLHKEEKDQLKKRKKTEIEILRDLENIGE